MSSAEKHVFQTEVQQLLHLMIHSLYSDKEIFLRELISNASDACDKLRFEALTNDALQAATEEELAIHISADKEKNTLTIRDNGIGMSRDEVIENIGTIARSGSKAFIENMSKEQAKDVHIIGQFGVGFYSVFMVADQTTLITRRADSDEAVKWISDGQGGYTIEETEFDGNGVEITLKLREDAKEFLDTWRLRSIVSKYSDHISMPVYLPKEPETRDEKDKKDDKVVLDQPQWEPANKGSALWARPKREIKEEEYNSFYQSLSYDQEAPLKVIHNFVEGKQEYITLLFIPRKAPFDLWDREHRHGLKLYVRRIFITEDNDKLLPPYLRFVRGIVDSADLPLNVSREFMQNNQLIDKIRAGSVKKILAELTRLAEKQPEEYQTFWDQFGKVMKEGIVDDPSNKDNLVKLFRFSTSKSDGENQIVSLDEYVNRMPAKQKNIYYLTAESYQAAAHSPHLEVFKKNDIEVLLLTDTIDEWLVGHLTEFEKRSIKSVSRGGLDDIEEMMSKKEKKDVKKATKEYGDLLEAIKKSLDERVKEVRLTNRLTESPACLVADETDMGANMERILKAMGQEAPDTKPILELNPDHPLVKRLQDDREQLDDWSQVLFDQAALAEGATLNDPASYVNRVTRLLTAQHLATAEVAAEQPTA